MKLCLKNELKTLLSVIKLSQSSISPLRMSLLFLSCFPFFSSQCWKGVGGRKEAVSQRRRKCGRAQWRRNDRGFPLLPTPLRRASCWQQASRQGEGGATDSESSLELWLFHFFFFELNYNCFTCCVSFCCAMK